MKYLLSLAMLVLIWQPATAQQPTVKQVIASNIFEGEPELVGYEYRPVYQRPQFERIVEQVPKQVKQWVQVEKTVFENVESVRRITPQPRVSAPQLPEPGLPIRSLPTIQSPREFPPIPNFPAPRAQRPPAIGSAPLRAAIRGLCPGS